MYKTPERLAFDKELGAALKRARIAAGLTRNDVSLDTDLNPSSIDRIERGGTGVGEGRSDRESERIAA